MGALTDFFKIDSLTKKEEPVSFKTITHHGYADPASILGKSSPPPSPFGSIITSGHSTFHGSSEYYEMMAEKARLIERDEAMKELADKLGLKSKQDVEELIKELGL